MPAPAIIRDLVQRFQSQFASYHHPGYNETGLRRDFLDPFFAALGWDMTNTGGGSEKYREVIHEASVEVEGAAKAADYAFRMGGNNVFFVEAKKPAVNIADSPAAAFQLRSYGWSGKLALSLLTDFEQLAVYDCRSKPKPGEAAHVGRVNLYHYSEYVDKWDEIYSRFSREAVFKGSFDEFAAGTKGKKGTTDVDDAFLEMLEGWRELLARNIALRNPGLSVRDLNFAVQTTIDRIIFLRICEDRGIEADDALRGATDGKDIYQDLLVLFKSADRKYNSGLFHFSDEKHQTSPADTLTPKLKIDDRVLKEILAGLYHPSPYAFKYIPADILGQVYERFLGKVIRLVNDHQAKVEEKPEVRKAGGVYYTPTYIVEYIVKNTLGELLQGQTPETQAARPLRVLDPACGSGSFLLGAYQYLLDWYLEWYAGNDPARHARGKSPAVVEAQGGWQLTMEKKKDILLAHIFGVDIDAQAVEVTKLSLLLKVVENPGQLSLLDERILPDLGENVKCGNSLIGPDYYNGRQMPMFGDAELDRVNPFDWHSAFKPVFAQGGFDAVIGNPPYIRIQALKEWAPQEVEFYKQRYVAASKGNYDIYVVFVEKGLSLLNPKGRLGFILPHKFFNAQYGQPLRGLIAEGRHLSKVVHFGDQQVFENATTYTCLMFLDKTGNDEFQFVKVNTIKDWNNEESELHNKINAQKVTDSEWNFTIGNDSPLFEKLSSMPVKLGNISEIFVGLQTSADTVFLFKEYTEQTDGYQVISKALNENVVVEKELLKQVVRSGEIGRYWARPTALVLFPYLSILGKSKLISEIDLKKKYPRIWNYLLLNKKLLSQREHGRFKETGWYQLYPKNLDSWERPKIMIPYMVTRLSAYYDENDYYFVNVTTGGFGLVLRESLGKPQYTVGLINSKLLDWYMKKVSTTFHGGYFAANKQFLVQLPIRTIDFNDPADVKRHERMVSLVENMLGLHKQLSAARSPQEKELLQRQIAFTDREIDALVYELYSLTEEEIKIVEGTG